ncbi:MAG: septum formation initiator family protein [Alistipes sp.]|nr:septum formation initiator family protein [Alistipes sp.]
MAKGKKSGFFSKILGDASLLFWRIFTIVISVLTLFIILRSAWSIVGSYRNIHRLNARAEQLQRQITADSTLVEQLKYDEHLERFAREHYNMQRPDEKVYILDY